MISIKDVARRAGVSVGTVSNVINRPTLVSGDTRARVLAAIDELGYVRSESARQLRAGHSRIMALLVLDIANPFFVDVARGAERAARAAGLGVMLCNSAQDPAEEADYLSLFAEQRVRGVLITPADANGANVASFRRHEIPFVMVDRVGPSDDLCSVSMDDVVGGELAVRHLIRAGHTAIAYVNGPASLAQCRDRLAGANKAIAESALPRTGPPPPRAPQLDLPEADLPEPDLLGAGPLGAGPLGVEPLGGGLPRASLPGGGLVETGLLGAGLPETGLGECALTVIEVEQMTVTSGRDAGSRLLGLSQRPTAVFCVNDLVALGVLQAMFAAGVRVPEEVSIVGYDDIEFAAAAAVPLTSVRQPAFRMGQTAAELLIEETGEAAAQHTHRRVVFQPELVVRESSRPRRG